MFHLLSQVSNELDAATNDFSGDGFLAGFAPPGPTTPPRVVFADATTFTMTSKADVASFASLSPLDGSLVAAPNPQTSAGNAAKVLLCGPYFYLFFRF